MNVDQYGQIILNESDLCQIYLHDPDKKIKNCLVQDPITFSDELELEHKPVIKNYVLETMSIQQFDERMFAQWKMPQEYQDMDIAKWLLDQCQSDVERQRVGEELLLFLDRNMFPLLKYLKYLVDTMRKYNVVWGVGRGSSVSSYVLYLIGVHKINSIYYDLDIHEFLK